MQFPFSLFGDLLAEFQKYLTNHISRPVYWVTGLVVLVLGGIIGYLSGWSAIMTAWNGTDAFLKIVLGTGAVLAFLLLAYLLGQLQGNVERWFQGDWPRQWQAGALAWHRLAWRKYKDRFQEMSDFYGKLYIALKEMKQWEAQKQGVHMALQVTHTVSCYTILTENDLAGVERDEASPDELSDLQACVGMMTLRSIEAGTVITGADVVRLPAGMEDAMITTLSVSMLIVPAGLTPGNLIVIYAQQQKKDSIAPFKPLLLLDTQQISDERANGTKADIARITLALSPDDVEAFIALSKRKIVRIVRSIAKTSPAQSAQASGNAPTEQPSSFSSSPLPPDGMSKQLKLLDSEYRTGKQWLKGLRDGVMNTEIPSHKEALEEAFVLIQRLSPTLSQDEQLQWLLKINDYRSGWISLLQDAYKEIEYRIDQQNKTFPLYYPSTLERVAPTAIGNVFHAVDSYCDALYGLDIALVLPRLQIVMEENTRDHLTTAHDQLELFEWLYLGSIAIGIIGTLLAFHAQHYLLTLLLWLLVLPIPRFILYPSALKAALDYAAALRLAVDNERGKIISKAGFSLSSPTSQEQEKALWKQIQQWWAYGASPGDYTMFMKGTNSDTNNERTS